MEYPFIERDDAAKLASRGEGMLINTSILLSSFASFNFARDHTMRTSSVGCE